MVQGLGDAAKESDHGGERMNRLLHIWTPMIVALVCALIVTVIMFWGFIGLAG